MSSLIPSAPVPLTSPVEDSDSLLPSFLQPKQKITYEVDDQYFKGYMSRRNGIHWFNFKSHPNKRQEEWGVDLPDLHHTWSSLCAEGILLPGHQASTFIQTPSSSTTFDPVANIVSAVNLHRDCPPSLLTALANTHPDREVWLQSYYKEKSSIKDMGTYQRLSLGEYRALREKGAPRAIPSMCVLTIKRDASLLPVHAKSRIVVLGNHEDRSWSKSERYAPVLKSESLRYFVSLAMEHRKTLQQDDYKNAFCNGDLPPDEVTIIRPPNGDPDTRKDEFWLLCKTLYGLRRSPRHWYDKIKKILLSMGLKQNIYDPCLFTGFVRDPDDPTEPPATAHLTLELYVDDFVFFSTSDEVEKKFQAILS